MQRNRELAYLGVARAVGIPADVSQVTRIARVGRLRLANKKRILALSPVTNTYLEIRLVEV
jgi:hypothetical protein